MITTHLKAVVEQTYEKPYVVHSTDGTKVMAYIFSQNL
jgi:hypothetical protein